MVRSETLQRCVVEAAGANRAGVGTKRGENIEQGHGSVSGVASEYTHYPGFLAVW
jgi:hypothetical protein